MRLYENLPKANDLVIIRTEENITGEGDHPKIRPEHIESVAISRINCELPFRVYDVEFNDPFDPPYAILEYEWLRLDGGREWVQIYVPLTDIKSLNGEPVQYIEIPKNFDPALADSFPSISLN